MNKRATYKLVRGYLQVGMMCLLVSGLAVLVLRLIDANVMGFTQLVWIRTWLVCAMFSYLVAVLTFLGRSIGSLLIIVIPFLTQYYQVCLGNEFPDGANSIMRLAPLIVMAIAMGIQVYHSRFVITCNELMGMLILLVIGLFSLVNSLVVTDIGFTCFFLMVMLVPTFYFFVGRLVKWSPIGPLIIQVGLSIGLFVLLLGTIGTTLVGLTLDLANAPGTLAGTRSVNDFNTVYSYIVLGWPLAFILLRQLHWLIIGLLVALMIGATALGFSRVSFFITPILLVVSFLVYVVRDPRRSLKVIAGLTIVLAWIVDRWSLGSEIVNVWMLRFDLSAQHATPSWRKLFEFINPQSSDAGTRLGLVDTALELHEQSPLFGHGWASFHAISDKGFSTAHNLTADLLVEAGIAGTLFFWILVLAIFLTLVRQFVRRGSVQVDVILLIASIVLWLVVAHTLGAGFYIASVTGFQVNAITGMLFALYLQPKLMKNVVTRIQS